MKSKKNKVSKPLKKHSSRRTYCEGVNKVDGHSNDNEIKNIQSLVETVKYLKNNTLSPNKLEDDTIQKIYAVESNVFLQGISNAYLLYLSMKKKDITPKKMFRIVSLMNKKDIHCVVHGSRQKLGEEIMKIIDENKTSSFVDSTNNIIDMQTFNCDILFDRLGFEKQTENEKNINNIEENESLLDYYSKI